MRIALALAFVLVPTLAHADRTTIVNLGVTGGAVGSTNFDYETPNHTRALTGPRLTLGFEGDLLPLPDAPGNRWGGQLVPELVLGSYFEHDRAEGYVGVGLRADLKIAQREQGLLKVSARGGIYLVGRATVIGSDRDPAYEFGFGEYLARFHNATRVGFELTFVDRPRDHGSEDSEMGGFLGLYGGWGL